MFFVLTLIWGALFGLLTLGLFWVIWTVVWAASPAPGSETWDFRFLLAKLTALTAVLGALVTLPLTLLRLGHSQRQTETQEQGLVTDRINKAVEGLGATKLVKTMVEKPRYQKQDGEWIKDFKGKPIPAQRPDGTPLVKREIIETTEPNLEVRIGSIYALERIAQDSLRDHIQIMEILCAYIRENSPVREAIRSFDVTIDVGPAEMVELANEPEEVRSPLKAHYLLRENTNNFNEWLQTLLRPRPDIQTAITAIGRRSAEQINVEQVGQLGAANPFRLDLRGANLQRIDMQRLNFSNALFNLSDLSGAYLSSTDLQNAIFGETSLVGADLQAARLDKAVFYSNKMEFIKFFGHEFKRARCTSIITDPHTARILAENQVEGSEVVTSF